MRSVLVLQWKNNDSLWDHDVNLLSEWTMIMGCRNSWCENYYYYWFNSVSTSYYEVFVRWASFVWML